MPEDFADPSARGNEHPAPVATNSTLKTWFRVGQILISGVLVGLFIQKSDGNSTLATIIYLVAGALGTVLVMIALMGVRFHRYVHSNSFAWFLSSTIRYIISGVFGLALAGYSFVGIDKNDADYEQGSSAGQSEHHSGQFELRNLQAVQDESSTRIAVSVINTAKAPTVIDRALLKTDPLFSGGQCISGGWDYIIDGQIVIRGDGKVAEGSVYVPSGPLTGRTVPARVDVIRFGRDCVEIAVENVQFPVILTLQPQEVQVLTIEIPRSMTMSDGKKVDFDLESGFQLAVRFSGDNSYAVIWNY